MNVMRRSRVALAEARLQRASGRCDLPAWQGKATQEGKKHARLPDLPAVTASTDVLSAKRDEHGRRMVCRDACRTAAAKTSLLQRIETGLAKPNTTVWEQELEPLHATVFMSRLNVEEPVLANDHNDPTAMTGSQT